VDVRSQNLISNVTARAASPRVWDRRDRRAVLSTGMPVYGASRADARFEQFTGAYFRYGVQFLPGMTVLDVGANIGLFSLEVLRRCGGDVNLFAFEPAPETFAHLERNIRALFPGARASIQRRALADRPGEATFYHRPRAPCLSSLDGSVRSDAPGGDPESLVEAALREPPAEFKERTPTWFTLLPQWAAKGIYRLVGRWAEEIVETTCTVTTISRVLRDHAIERVDFLKVDVEGAELDVLRGIEADDWPKIRTLVVEIHDVDHRVETIRGMLNSAGFEHVHVGQDWPHEGTNLYLLHAARVQHAVARAS
jgi:FkbM family methyltransferase